MLEKYCLRIFSVVLFIYIAWVWMFNIDESIVPQDVVYAWWQQGTRLYFPVLVEYIHPVRYPLALISLLMIVFYLNFGRWIFLIFSVTGPTLYMSDGGWLYKMDWLENLEYAVQMIQGALIAICFFGESAKSFTWYPLQKFRD